jgi:hypothetical protein
VLLRVFKRNKGVRRQMSVAELLLVLLSEVRVEQGLCAVLEDVR